MLRELGWDGSSSRLPEALANAVASATAGWPEDLAGASEQYSAAIPAMVLRIVPLTGPDGGRIGVFLERSRRDRLERTALQYQVSARELEVMRLLLRGLASEEIARELGISENTVITYMRNVIAKTGSKNRSEAIGKLLAS
jgi:DNA-binding CsgD family transcriptional regulator